MFLIQLSTALYLLDYVNTCNGNDTDKLVPNVSLTVEGGGSLVGEHCPGTVRLFCEGVCLTHLRWSYNSTDQEIVFFELDEEIKIIHLPSSSPFTSVELSNVSQSELAIFGNFSSILTLNISQLEQQHITEIRCGDPESDAIVPVNVELRQQSPPESPQLINISFSKISLIVLWEPPMEAICSSYDELFLYNITLFREENKLTKILTKSSVCSEVCNVTLPLSGPGNYQFELQAVNNKGTSDPVIQNFNISVRCEIPSPVANGEFLTSNLTEGGTLTLTCDERFRIMGPAMANCTRDSLWQPNLENTSHCVHKSIESPTTCNISGEWNINRVCNHHDEESEDHSLVIAVSCATGAIIIVIGFIIIVMVSCQRKVRRNRVKQRFVNEARYIDWELDPVQEGSFLNLGNDMHEVIPPIQSNIQQNQNQESIAGSDLELEDGVANSTVDDTETDGVTNQATPDHDDMVYSRLDQPGGFVAQQQTSSSSDDMVYSTLVHGGPKLRARGREKQELTDTNTQQEIPNTLGYSSGNYSLLDTEAIDRTVTVSANSEEKSDLEAVETDVSVDFNQALVQLKGVQNKWRQIGKALLVPEAHIEQIEPYCTNNNALGMSGMIGYWMKNCSGQPSWRELLNALATVGEKQLADKLMDANETGCRPVEFNFEKNLIPLNEPPPSPSPLPRTPSPADVTGPLADRET